MWDFENLWRRAAISSSFKSLIMAGNCCRLQKCVIHDGVAVPWFNLGRFNSNGRMSPSGSDKLDQLQMMLAHLLEQETHCFSNKVKSTVPKGIECDGLLEHDRDSVGVGWFKSTTTKSGWNLELSTKLVGRPLAITDWSVIERSDSSNISQSVCDVVIPKFTLESEIGRVSKFLGNLLRMTAEQVSFKGMRHHGIGEANLENQISKDFIEFLVFGSFAFSLRLSSFLHVEMELMLRNWRNKQAQHWA
ncbi:hypothetical protein Tco_0977657 [Tanacetum coccineum]|uniref:Uncharacterized protein n=1 Tax=Tanacetum coccineum TaxID=301880 RepID=A0ABQ5EKS9_9ASTR